MPTQDHSLTKWKVLQESITIVQTTVTAAVMVAVTAVVTAVVTAAVTAAVKVAGRGIRVIAVFRQNNMQQMETYKAKSFK